MYGQRLRADLNESVKISFRTKGNPVNLMFQISSNFISARSRKPRPNSRIFKAN
jgi:hypothetical protein